MLVNQKLEVEVRVMGERGCREPPANALFSASEFFSGQALTLVVVVKFKPYI